MIGRVQTQAFCRTVTESRNCVGFCQSQGSGLGRNDAHSGERAPSCDPPTVQCSCREDVPVLRPREERSEPRCKSESDLAVERNILRCAPENRQQGISAGSANRIERMLQQYPSDL